LQLLRAGDCLLLVELPTGEAFQSRDPAYVLLKDLLRAAGLPDSPQLIGEPVRWPLLTRGNLAQGPDAARDFVQGFVAVQLEEGACACLWLVGLPAVRYAGEADAGAYNRELQIDGLGSAWALPGLELLMDEPVRKAELWQAMRRVRQRWMSGSE
ncbi:MAG: energy transducer TonB, partial [Pseudomonas sp.]